MKTLAITLSAFLAANVVTKTPAPQTQVGQAAPNASEPQTTFGKGLTSAIRLFGELRLSISTIIKPAEKDQALRYLRTLSRRLSALILEKDDFALVLQQANYSKPNPPLEVLDSAEDLLDQLRKVRNSLEDVFESLPDDYRRRGSSVRGELEVGLNSKMESLSAVSQLLGTPGASQAEMAAKVRADAEIARRLRLQIDGMIEDLAKGR